MAPTQSDEVALLRTALLLLLGLLLVPGLSGLLEDAVHVLATGHTLDDDHGSAHGAAATLHTADHDRDCGEGSGGGHGCAGGDGCALGHCGGAAFLSPGRTTVLRLPMLVTALADAARVPARDGVTAGLDRPPRA